MTKRYVGFMGIAGGTVLFAVSAQALVLVETSPEQACRKAGAKATAKYVSCVTKATLTCEKKGTTGDVECLRKYGDDHHRRPEGGNEVHGLPGQVRR